MGLGECWAPAADSVAALFTSNSHDDYALAAPAASRTAVATDGPGSNS